MVPGSNGGAFFSDFQGDAFPGARFGAAATGLARPSGSSFGWTPANEWAGRPTGECPPEATAALPGSKAASTAIGATTPTPTTDRRLKLIKAPPNQLVNAEADHHHCRTEGDHPRRSWSSPARRPFVSSTALFGHTRLSGSHTRLSSAAAMSPQCL